MNKLAIYGAGGLGREIACLVSDVNRQRPQWDVVGFYDDGKEKNTVVDELRVLGGLEEINACDEKLSLVMAIANPATKEKLVNSITNTLIDFPVLIHPLCYSGSASFNHFGRGVVLTAGTMLTTHIFAGEFVLINLSTTIGHDVSIGKFSSVMPGCNISGNVTLGDRCMIGTGARILQNITIGAGSIVGAGAVITKSFGPGVKLIGVPGRNKN